MTETPFFTPTSADPISLRGTTLVIPAVSIGSVPQLAIDLLLHDSSLKLVKVGRIDPSFCFPFVGPSDSEDADVTTAIEVFSNGQLTVIQQRSPVYNSLARPYITALTEWISATNFAEVLWLTSIEAAARTDDEFSTPILSLFPTSEPASTPVLSRLSSQYPPFKPPADARVPLGKQVQSSIPHIPGSLLTRKLLHTVAQGQGKVNLGALLYFASEGDTRPDAHFLATTLLTLLSLTSPQSFTEPPSWNALFGRPAEPSLYA